MQSSRPTKISIMLKAGCCFIGLNKKDGSREGEIERAERGESILQSRQFSTWSGYADFDQDIQLEFAPVAACGVVEISFKQE